LPLIADSRASVIAWSGHLGNAGSYAAEKGKNAATKEDIEVITKKVEAVKAAFEADGQAREHQSHLFLQSQDFTPKPIASWVRRDDSGTLASDAHCTAGSATTP